jgi:hypothetical protein
MKNEKNIETIAHDAAEQLTAWTNDMNVRVHLAEMSARDAWREIEPQLALAEGRLRTAIASLPSSKDLASTDVRHALADVRDALRNAKPTLVTVGEDLSKAGHLLLERLERELGPETSA